MEKLKKMEESQYTTLARVLFGLEAPSPISANSDDLEAQVEQMHFFDPTLNDSQKDAVKFALASREVALIHGPPGVSLPQSPTDLFTDLQPRLERHIHLSN